MRLIAADGSQVGIIQTRKALEMAREAGLDLVVVALNVHPPVARIVDYGKYKYDLDKKKKTGKERAKTQDIKGIKLRPGIALGDLQIALKKIHAWIADGDKVKVQVQFRAREITHPEVGRQKLDWLLERVSGDVAVERMPSLDGMFMTMLLMPNKAKPSGGAKHEQAKNQQNSQQAVQD